MTKEININCYDCIYKIRTGVNWKKGTTEEECALEKDMTAPYCEFKVDFNHWYETLPDSTEIK